jgi:hypothetical protein
MPLVAQNRSSNVCFIKLDFAEFSEGQLILKKSLLRSQHDQSGGMICWERGQVSSPPGTAIDPRYGRSDGDSALASDDPATNLIVNDPPCRLMERHSNLLKIRTYLSGVERSFAHAKSRQKHGQMGRYAPLSPGATAA